MICLSSNPATLTAWSNDYEFETVFSRQVEAYGSEGAVLLGISTSGTSPNIVCAFQRARQMGMITIALTGEGGGHLAPLADHLLAAPSRHTPLIQQVHLCFVSLLLAAKLSAACAPQPDRRRWQRPPLVLDAGPSAGCAFPLLVASRGVDWNTSSGALSW